jgi:exodeoxyribonuclease-5
MTAPAIAFSEEQAEAHDRIAEMLRGVGVDLDHGTITPMAEGKSSVLAVIGKAGSGKTLLLAELVRALEGAGVEIVSGDWEGRRRKDRRTPPSSRPRTRPRACCGAAACRPRRSTASSIRRSTTRSTRRSPNGSRAMASARDRGLTDELLDRAKAVYDLHKSVPAALASAGLRGSDFITGWKRREDPLDIGLVDESSMLDDAAIRGFGRDLPRPRPLRRPGAARARGPIRRDGLRPAAVAAVGTPSRPPAGGRQSDPRSRPCPRRSESLTFERFERMVEDAARTDPRS